MIKQSLRMAAVAALLFPVMAQAQSTSPRGFVVVNGAYQLAQNDFRDGATTRVNAEDGRIDSTYTVKTGVAFDLAGGGVFFGHLGAGVGVSRFSVATPGSLQATIPHPFFFNQSRSVSAEVSNLKRDELAIHLQARGVFPIGPRLQVMVFGGPTFFQVKQDVITDYTYAESYPFDVATFRGATVAQADGSKVGYNAGADIAFFFTRQVGIGGMVQFAGATIDLSAADSTTHSVKVGGGQAGAGLRLRF